MGTRHMIAWATTSRRRSASIPQAGGDAIDAGICAGLAISVLESAYVAFAGVAPMTTYLRDIRRVITVSGLGTWPGRIVRAVPIPAWRPDPQGHPAHSGSRGAGRLAGRAARLWHHVVRRCRRLGYPPGARRLRDVSADGGTLRFFAADIAAYPSSAAIYLPGGVAPTVGQLFRQRDLAATLQFMADEEAAAAPAAAPPVSMRRATLSTAATSPPRSRISIATMAA